MSQLNKINGLLKGIKIKPLTQADVDSFTVNKSVSEKATPFYVALAQWGFITDQQRIYRKDLLLTIALVVTLNKLADRELKPLALRTTLEELTRSQNPTVTHDEMTDAVVEFFIAYNNLTFKSDGVEILNRSVVF